jgi:hypothetical protein
VCRQSDSSGVFEDMLHLLGAMDCIVDANTRWYAKLSMAHGLPDTSHRFVRRVFGFVSRWPGRRGVSLCFLAWLLTGVGYL